MNFYVVVEGKTDKDVYKKWIPLVNPNLNYVEKLDDVKKNNFLIVSSRGFPDILESVENAIKDVNNFLDFDRLVVALDSEDYSKNEKDKELQFFLQDKKCRVPIITIIQHFCLETWALGNRRVFKKNIKNPKLKKYKQIFDVRKLDPEELPPYKEEYNRAQFAYQYLKLICQERYDLKYSKKGKFKKKNPLLHPKYFEEVKKRFEETNHISSFGDFLKAW